MKRKIAESINLRINIKNFQHIELVKYAEEEIEYSNDEERVAAEKALTNDLTDSLKNSIQIIVDKIGRGRKEAIEVEENIQKIVPEWLDDQNIPNIAKGSNPALDKKEKTALVQRDDLDKTEAIDEELAELEPNESNDLNETNGDSVKETKTKTKTKTKTEKIEDTDDFFDDEDIFG